MLEYFSFKAKIDDASFLTELKKSFLRNQPRIDISETKTNSTLNLERHLVHLILSGKETAKRVFKAVNLEDFSNPALKSIATTCLQMIDKNEDVEIDKLIDQTDDPEIRSRLTQFGLEPLEFDSPEKTVSDCVTKFNNVHIKSKIKTAKPYLESYIDIVVAGKDGSSPSKRVEMANKILPIVGKVHNLVERKGLLEYFSF